MAGDARRISRKAVSRVDAVVTSPPYLSAQDYYRSNKLELAICGLWYPNMEYTLGKQIIGSGRGGILTSEGRKRRSQYRACNISLPSLSDRSNAVVRDYLDDMRQMLERLQWCLRQGGKCCLIIGDSTIRGTPFARSRVVHPSSGGGRISFVWPRN